MSETWLIPATGKPRVPHPVSETDSEMNGFEIRIQNTVQETRNWIHKLFVQLNTRTMKESRSHLQARLKWVVRIFNMKNE